MHPANGQWCTTHYRDTLSDRERNRASRNRPKTEDVRPTFSHSAPPKTSKAKLKKCAEIASQGVSWFVEESLYEIEDDGYNPYVGSNLPHLKNHLHEATYCDTPLRDWSKSQDPDDKQALAEIALAAFSRPWPGETGPTDARVLAGLLQAGKLTVVTGLDEFGHEIGLANRTVRTALERLDSEGWGRFELGDPDRYDADGIEEPGKPSTFTLEPRTVPTGTYSPMGLPWLISDLFTRDDLGSAGWLLLSRLLVEHRDERDPMPVVGTADIVRLTGVSRSTAIRLKKKLVSARLGRVVEGDKVRVTSLRDTTETNRNESRFDNQAHRKRQDKRNARGQARDKARKAHTEANKPPAKVLQIA
jgi:hypothetical protein